MAAITVEAKVIGQRRPLLENWEVPLPPAVADRATLRDLIEAVVRAEVAAFLERRAERRLTRVLTREQVTAGAARGKIAMGGREEAEPDVEPDRAVETALAAFQDGLYYVFVDDRQVTSLEAPLALQPQSRITFLRLVALAGG